jgi:hypothetical protein
MYWFYHGLPPEPVGRRRVHGSGAVPEEGGSGLDERDRVGLRRLVWLVSALLAKRASDDVGRPGAAPQGCLAADDLRDDDAVR